MSKGLNVHSEIGALKKVCVHRPGLDLVNMKAEDFERAWIHDAFYLEYAQREHDEFTDLLRVLALRSSIWRTCLPRLSIRLRVLVPSL